MACKVKKFIPLLPGDAKPRSTHPSHLVKGPAIKYKQQEGQQNCMVYSFASTLHHIGGEARQAASELCWKSKKIINKIDTIQQFYSIVKDCDGCFIFQKIKNKQRDFLKNGNDDLVVVLVKGNNGKDDHCVTLYGKWLFDSNFDYALPL